jgi:hypothetical protein
MQNQARPGHGAADWLSLAAAPTFAFMALLTAVPGGGPLDMLCSGATGASSFSGMVLMYLLMSAFHLAPWLRLISSRRISVGTGRTGHSLRKAARNGRAFLHDRSTFRARPAGHRAD